MKKILLTICGILAFILFLGILQDAALIKDDDDVLEIAYDKLYLDEDDVDLKIIAYSDYDGKRLFWLSRLFNDSQDTKYFYITFKIIGDEEYEYIKGPHGVKQNIDDCAHSPTMFVAEGYHAFLINNPDCAYIRIEETTGFTDIPVESIPFSYVYEITDEFVDFSYLFADKTPIPIGYKVD